MGPEDSRIIYIIHTTSLYLIHSLIVIDLYICVSDVRMLEPMSYIVFPCVYNTPQGTNKKRASTVMGLCAKDAPRCEDFSS